MRLISLNVGLFEDNNEKLKRFLRAQKADIVGLQEVTRKVDESAFDHFISKETIDQATKKLAYPFFAPCMVLRELVQKNFHGKETFQFNLNGFVELGNYVKSRFEIFQARNIFVQNCFSYVTDMSKWPAEDYRAVEVVDMNIGNKRLRLLNYHGVWTRNKLGNTLAYSACKKVYELATEEDYPSIICGDFNLFPETDSIKLFQRGFTSLVDKFNIKTTRPSSNELHGKKRNVVDYIFVGKGIKVENFKVLQLDISDHFPLVLDFEF